MDGFDDRGPRPSGPSEKQIAFIGTLQQRLKLTNEQLDALVKEVTGAESLAELSRGHASTLIDDLMNRAKEAGVDGPPTGAVATEKQVKFMKSLQKKAKLDAAGFEKLLMENANVKEPELVGKREASLVIDKLLALTGEAPRPAPARGGGRFAPRGKPPAGPARGPAGPPEAAPTGGAAGGAAPDERAPDRPGDGPEDDLPF